ncbi:hypothetical protein AB6A40_005175 [Gnathostoma spinigerum]|uniref:Uncharacterized protein n=1 Tax=Gnathostoma spinigerum TaxID=75299 RepID=A0ABD6EGX4_9BILA
MMLMLLFLLASSFLLDEVKSVCPDQITCIDQISRLAADQRRFWFGDQWRDVCSGRHRDEVRCYSPRTLRAFHSLGSRLFRIRAYQNAFLAGLRIWPRVTYRVTPGKYRACDHDFEVNVPPNTVIEADPEMEPIEPFKIRYLPDIRWRGMDINGSYVVLITDVGFGVLNFLAYDFPRDTKIVQSYAPPENFRPLPNPLVVLIFEPTGDRSRNYTDLNAKDENDLFDLTKFILQNSLEGALIGMNIVLVSYDAFAIERQRLRGTIDNCHSILEKKLRRENRWSFTNSFPLSELNAWLSVDYYQPKMTYFACCHKVDITESKILLDPLDDRRLPSIAVQNEPHLYASKTGQPELSYQRMAREFDHKGFDQLYTVVLFDPVDPMLYWMVIDIPSASLITDSIVGGITVVPYFSPVPIIPNSCEPRVFMMFTQTRARSPSPIAEYYSTERSNLPLECRENCSFRHSFDIEEFKAFHQLKLAAINWMFVCYDIHEAYRRIVTLKNNDTNLMNENKRNENIKADRISAMSLVDSWYEDDDRFALRDSGRRRSSPETEICTSLGLPTQSTCPNSGSAQGHFWTLQRLFVLYTLIQIMFTC